MQVTPRELRDMDIREGFRGYNRDEVDELLERAATTIEELQERIRKLSNQLAEAEAAPPPAPQHREAEETIHRTLLLAQRAADEAVAEAQAEAARVVEEAKARAASIVADAEAGARRLAEGERRRLEHEVLELGARRDALLADVDALERFAADYRERLRRMLQEDLETLTARATVSLPRPTLHEVDLPGPGPTGSSGAAGEVTEAAHGAGDREPLPAPGPTAGDPGAPTRELHHGGAGPTTGSPHGSTDAAAVGAAPVVDGPATLAPSETAPLDDEAFFASLRDAVRNPEPLGPRDLSQPPGETHDPAGGAGLTGDEKAGGFFRRRR